MESKFTQNFVCRIRYQAPTPPVNLATCVFSVGSTGKLRPGDTITFEFESPEQGRPLTATLLASCKEPTGKRGSSPFLNDANSIDILSQPKLTLGNRPGAWGLAVLFTVDATKDTHFYYLPDPEIIVSPE